MSEFDLDIPSSSQIPGTFLEISTAPNSTTTELPKNLLLLATAILQGSAITGAPYNLTAGTADPNDISLYSDQNRVSLAFNRRSPIANRFRSALQEIPFGVNLYLASVAESVNSGFAGYATKLLKAVGTAVGSGQVSVKLCGFEAFVPVANGDSASLFAASQKTAIDRQTLDAPMITGANIDIQLPTITIATNATGTSNFVITADGVVKTVALTAGWTPTQSATAIAAALTTDTAYPLSATSNAGVLTLAWRAGFPVASLTISTTDSAQTFTLTYRTTAASAGVTTPLIYVVRGEEGNDSPIVVTIPPEITGLKLSPASMTTATTSVGHSGGASLFIATVGSLSVATSIPASTTPANTNTLIEAAVNAATFPLTADANGATVQFFFRSGWVFNRLQLSSTEDAMGQTYALYDRHDSAGAITAAVTVAGSPTPTALQGAGIPNLTTVLDNKAKMPLMIEWSSDYTDITSINAEAAHVELYANGFFQQGQRTTRGSTALVEDVADIPGNATPNLGNFWRHSILTYQDPPSQGGAFAAQTAARLCATDLPYNFDGFTLKTGGSQPLLPARADTEFSPTTLEVILSTYHLTPLKSVNGLVSIVRGRNTWSGQGRWGDWSYGRIFDQVRFELGAFLNNRFAGKVLFRQTSNIRVLNAFTLSDVRNAIGEYLDSRNGIIIDGSQTLKQLIIVTIDDVDDSRILIQVAARPPVENHQRVGRLVSAPN